jgi:hypothetical protein
MSVQNSISSKKIQCPRCGGSGETEHTHVVYGVCFMCKGSGEVFPQRVGELTERALKRKANKQAKRDAEELEYKTKQEAHEAEQESFSRPIFDAHIESADSSKVEEQLSYLKIDRIEKHLYPNGATLEEFCGVVLDFGAEPLYKGTAFGFLAFGRRCGRFAVLNYIKNRFGVIAEGLEYDNERDQVLDYNGHNDWFDFPNE